MKHFEAALALDGELLDEAAKLNEGCKFFWGTFDDEVGKTPTPPLSTR